MQALGGEDEDGEGGDAGSGTDEGGNEEMQEGPPTYPALQARRDSVRGWLCVLYSFAAPNRCEIVTCNGRLAQGWEHCL